MKKKNQDEIKL